MDDFQKAYLKNTFLNSPIQITKFIRDCSLEFQATCFKAETFTQWSKNINNKNLLFTRLHRFNCGTTGHVETDVYGNYWCALYLDLNLSNQLEFTVDRRIIRLKEGKTLILFPPHSIVQWRIFCPELLWSAFVSFDTYPEYFPPTPSLFQLQDDQQYIDVNHGIALPMASNSKNIAVLLKEKLDQEFKLNKELNQYSTEFKYSKEGLIRKFKKTYGITPIAYRNKKRILQATIELQLKSSPIVDVALQAGFGDLSHFYQIFREIVRATPRQFLNS